MEGDSFGMAHAIAGTARRPANYLAATWIYWQSQKVHDENIITDSPESVNRSHGPRRAFSKLLSGRVVRLIAQGVFTLLAGRSRCAGYKSQDVGAAWRASGGPSPVGACSLRSGCLFGAPGSVARPRCHNRQSQRRPSPRKSICFQEAMRRPHSRVALGKHCQLVQVLANAQSQPERPELYTQTLHNSEERRQCWSSHSDAGQPEGRS